MLAQRGVVSRVPETDAWSQPAAVRGSGIMVSFLRSSGLATDWGVQSRLVGFIARQTRSQLSIVLEGRGYVAGDSGIVLLAPGDVVELDQRRHDDEGYGGSPCEVLVVEWDEGRLGPRYVGAPRVSRIGASDVLRLRALTARYDASEPDAWVRELGETLRALGMQVPRILDVALDASPHERRVYAALAGARARLDRQPALVELASELGLSERHVRRAFEQLERHHAMTISSWRDFITDARLHHAQQLLTIPQLSMKRVAELSGFRSSVALSHAFSQRCGESPGSVARLLRERWR